MSSDVLIIGGGLVGMLTAHHLQKEGLKVALIEKDQIGKAASWAAGGILSKLYPWQQSAALQHLIERGQAAFPEFVATLQSETGIDAQLLQSGMLITDTNEQQTALGWSRENNIYLEILDRYQINKLEPGLAENIDSAIYIPSVMQVRPPHLIKAVQQSLINHGIKIFTGVTAKKLILDDEKVIGVETNHEPMFAEQTVICNGAWTKQLLEQSSDRLPDIEPVCGQMLLFKTKQNLMTHIIVKDGFYLIPRQDQFILCGSTLEHIGFNHSTTRKAKELLSYQAHQLCPALVNEPIVKHWSALRPGTSRALPYICTHPDYENLYINAGHFRYGIVTSVPTAKIAAEFIVNKLNTSQISEFAW